MTKFFVIDPEVAGHFGKGAILNQAVRPVIVTRFHYEFDGWTGDDLLTTMATYVGTLRLAGAIQTLQPKATGINFDVVEVSKSGEYRQWEPLVPKDLPDCVWLQINGTPGSDDFGLSIDQRLVVSERVLKVLQSFNLKHCDIAEYAPART
jgi:hypothetical protein